MFFSQQVAADLSVAQLHVNDAKIVGEARLKVLFWNVFDAKLYAENGVFDQAKPFALSLSYLRKINSSEIVAKSLSEIQSQAEFSTEKLATWKLELKKIIPDVDKSTTITGVQNANFQTLFYKNDALIGQIDDPEFTRAFFNIWLGEKTSEPKLRKQLLNQAYWYGNSGTSDDPMSEKHDHDLG